MIMCGGMQKKQETVEKKEREKTKKRKPKLDDLLKYDWIMNLTLLLVTLFFSYEMTYPHEIDLALVLLTYHIPMNVLYCTHFDRKLFAVNCMHFFEKKVDVEQCLIQVHAHDIH